VTDRDPQVTVAVVSFNTRELLLRCLASLASEAAAGRAEVWVIDNGSSDGSLDAARASAPWAATVDAGQNLGFGRAVNFVAERTRSQWLLVANADVALEPKALGALLEGGANSRVGCVAPRLLGADGATQQSVHPFPTVPLTLAVNLYIHRLSRTLGERLCLDGFWDPERPRMVPWALGACLLLRRAAFDDVGGFDARQWMYAEDLDLQWRLRDRGWLTRYEPRARVRHAAAAATGPAFGEARTGRFMRATYVMLGRRRGSLRMWTTAAINIAGAAARVLATAPLSPLSRRCRAVHAESRRWLKAHVLGLPLHRRPALSGRERQAVAP
jgi:N-acetylglucosaminyl-diphospho-decaprenol L-rhamnosyltransferase